MLFIEYPKCSTSNKAKKWLNDNGLLFAKRNIKEDNPTYEELKLWHEKSGLEIKKFFNTSGRLYREQNIKEVLETAGIEESLKILSTDGMMVKRPILVGDDFVLVGFKEEVWKNKVIK